jgi:DNA polymerase-1
VEYDNVLQDKLEALPFEVVLVDTSEKLCKLINELELQKVFSLDTETTSLNPREAELVGVSLCWGSDVAYYIPIIEDTKYELLHNLKIVLRDPNIKKIGQNIKYDCIVLKNYGIELKGVVFDTSIASYLLAPGTKRHNLDALAKRYLNHETIKFSEMFSKMDAQRAQDVPLGIMCGYAAEDAWVVWMIWEQLGLELQEQELSDLFFDVELPLSLILGDMEFNGVHIDTEKMLGLSLGFDVKINDLRDTIYKLCGNREINTESPKQLAQVLYNDLALPIKERTETGQPSTGVDALEALKDLHELPKTILDLRKYMKLKNTYTSVLPKLVLHKTGRLHGSFNQIVTATGRLSSSDPNLQNIPAHGDEGKEIRSCFIPESGNVFIGADYSQIELRVLAHFSQDEKMLEAFRNDKDIHTLVASEVNKVPLDEVTSEMRSAAKTINFGIIYGLGPAGLAKDLGITKDEATGYINKYFMRFMGVKKFMKQVLKWYYSNDWVATIMGRKRYFADPGNDYAKKSQQERMAFNAVIQGTAADIIKLAMIAVSNVLVGSNSKVILQVHDELLIESREDEAEYILKAVKNIMENVMQLSVPLKVDVKIGNSWAEVH